MQKQIDTEKESYQKLQSDLADSQNFNDKLKIENEKHLQEIQSQLELATGEQAKHERELSDQELAKAKLLAAEKDKEIEELKLKIEKIQLDFDRRLKERDLIGDEFKQSFNAKLDLANDENKRLIKTMKQMEENHDVELIEYRKFA